MHGSGDGLALTAISLRTDTDRHLRFPGTTSTPALTLRSLPESELEMSFSKVSEN